MFPRFSCKKQNTINFSYLPVFVKDLFANTPLSFYEKKNNVVYLETTFLLLSLPRSPRHFFRNPILGKHCVIATRKNWVELTFGTFGQ